MPQEQKPKIQQNQHSKQSSPAEFSPLRRAADVVLEWSDDLSPLTRSTLKALRNSQQDPAFLLPLVRASIDLLLSSKQPSLRLREGVSPSVKPILRLALQAISQACHLTSLAEKNASASPNLSCEISKERPQQTFKKPPA
jgi:hypothetical protein